MDETPSLLQIKGLRDGLLIKLGEAPWPDLEAAFIKYIDDMPAFFQGARVALDVGPQVLHVVELSALRDHLSERGVSLWAILSELPVTETTAQNLGMATRLSKPRQSDDQGTPEAIPENAALWVQQTVHSGQKVAYEGHVVIFGDVNPGAEIVAGGSVIVWGRLRGVVHAGAQGDEKAVVCALEMSPTQLRIASEIAVSPKKEKKNQPEIAHLQDGNLIAEPWQENKAFGTVT